jgi:hypothetical protein
MERLNKALAILGIIFIIIACATFSFLEGVSTRIGILGFVLLILGVFFPNIKTTGIKTAEKSNYREKDSEDNCINCKYCTMKLFKGLEAGCEFFEIKVDDGYVCDLYETNDANNLENE